MARSLCGYPPRLFGFATAVSVVGAPIVAGAVARLVAEPGKTAALIGAAAFFVCALVSELKPVSLDIEGRRVVSLAFIPIITAQVLFGWQYAVAVGVGAMLVAQLASRDLGLRLCFNCSVYALGTGLGALVGLLHMTGSRPGFGGLVGLVFVEGAIFITVNVVLVCAVMALQEGKRLRSVLVDHLRHSGPAFLMMAAIAALAASLWVVSPALLLLLVGPLLTLGLYQRYARSMRVAWQAAETDWLTGLGNRRAYEQAIRTAVEHATAEEPVTLCLADLDDFKRINDTHGHTAGDESLAAVAARFAAIEGAEAFRLGGDEFALLVQGGADCAVEHVRSVQADLAHDGEQRPLGISVGIASCPESTQDDLELQRLADRALYWTKKNGKGRWCVYSPGVVELSWLGAADSAGYDERLRAVESLVRLAGSSRPPAAALEELERRCGRQIEPALIDAVAALLVERRGAGARSAAAIGA